LNQAEGATDDSSAEASSLHHDDAGGAARSEAGEAARGSQTAVYAVVAVALAIGSYVAVERLVG